VPTFIVPVATLAVTVPTKEPLVIVTAGELEIDTVPTFIVPEGILAARIPPLVTKGI
jgi:hypothetical protein